jgi:hypothetical protein
MPVTYSTVVSVASSEPGVIHHYHLIIIPEEKKAKFALEKYDPGTMPYTEFHTKVLLSLIRIKHAHLLYDSCTTPENAAACSLLAVELFNKCKGSDKLVFASLKARKGLVFKGKGIEMLQLLCNHFGLISDDGARNLQIQLQSMNHAQIQNLAATFKFNSSL